MAEITRAEHFLIVQQCTHLCARFAHVNDGRDFDALAALFTEDAVFARPSAPDQLIRGRAAIDAQFRARPANKRTRHFCANTFVTVISATEAKAHTYVKLYTAAEPETKGAIAPADAKQIIGAYDDTIVRDSDGVWRFKERIGSLAMSVG